MFKLFGFLRKTKTPMIPQADYDVMLRYAQGDETVKHDAIAAYRRNMLLDKNDLVMRFMAEVDTPVPDLALRSDLRKRLNTKAA